MIRHTRFAVVIGVQTVALPIGAGEGAPSTGLKPAGRSNGPVIPVAERARETGSGDELIGVLNDVVAEQVKHRLEVAMERKTHADAGVAEAREYVEAMLGLQVWSQKFYLAALASAHGGEHQPEG